MDEGGPSMAGRRSSYPACDGHQEIVSPFIVAGFATKQPSECILRQISILDLSNKHDTAATHCGIHCTRRNLSILRT